MKRFLSFNHLNLLSNNVSKNISTFISRSNLTKASIKTSDEQLCDIKKQECETSCIKKSDLSNLKLNMETFTIKQLNDLRQKFQNPQFLINKLIKNYTDLYPSKAPKISIEPILNSIHLNFKINTILS